MASCDAVLQERVRPVLLFPDPHRKFVASRFAKMQPAAAGKRERFDRDGASGGFDGCARGGEIVDLDNSEGASGLFRGVALKPEGLAILKVDVLVPRAVAVALKPEGCVEEGRRGSRVVRGKLHHRQSHHGAIVVPVAGD